MLARRAFLGIGRTGLLNGERIGRLRACILDRVVRQAHARAAAVRLPDRRASERRDVAAVPGGVSEATEEAVYNAMLQAVTDSGMRGHRLEALPVAVVREVVERHTLSGMRMPR